MLGGRCRCRGEVGCSCRQEKVQYEVSSIFDLLSSQLSPTFYHLRHVAEAQTYPLIQAAPTMAEITHPTIKDGWFQERSHMWPGQAMTLKVNQVLHHEKSKYQDVLIFESSDYGMVLVLDNVIQCTERDEFSYQEMITHLAMFAHPNPKKVLGIGGGDGGVLREIVKHECVEEAVLVDIDEAVIRLSI